MNSINLIGRLAKDWERLDGTRALIKSTLVVDNGKNRDAMFIDLVSFNEKTMDINEKYTAKGSKIGVSGQLASNNWTDKSGNKRTSYSIIVNRIDFLDTNNNEPKEPKDYVENNKYVRDEPSEKKVIDKGDGILWD